MREKKVPCGIALFPEMYYDRNTDPERAGLRVLSFALLRMEGRKSLKKYGRVDDERIACGI